MTTIVLAIITMMYLDIPVWVKAVLVFAIGVDISIALKNK